MNWNQGRRAIKDLFYNAIRPGLGRSWPLLLMVFTFWMCFEISFQQLIKIHTQITKSALFSLLRDENKSLNPYAISKQIEDFESSGLIKCSVLFYTNHVPYLDLRYRSNCDSKKWIELFQSEAVSHQLKSIGGEEWSIHYIPGIPIGLYLARIGLRIICLLCFVIVWYWPAKMAKLESAFLKKENDLLQEKNKIARQLAHDIRSPLTALEMALNMNATQLDPYSSKRLVQKAVSRIKEMAEDLLRENRNQIIKSDKTTNEKIVRVASFWQLLNDNLQEITPYCLKNNIELIPMFNDSAQSYYAKLPINEIKRAISNILNNAIEATNLLPLNFEKKIIIKLNTKFDGMKEFITVSILDNGPGIPEEILNKLTKENVTAGKEDGNGIGVMQAHQVIREINGKLIYKSQRGKESFTEVLIEIPRCTNPSWHVEKIEQESDTVLISIDNDPSITEIVQQRFSALKIISMQDPNEYSHWAKNNHHLKHFILVDYEFDQKDMNGIDFIINNNLADRSILCTGHSDEYEIQDFCYQNNIKLLPKNQLPKIPIHIKCFVMKNVLIDDDELLTLAYKIKDPNMLCFNSVEEFFKHNISPKEVRSITIDSELGNGIKGEIIAEEIYKKGFSPIILSTGHSPEDFDLNALPWISKINTK